MSRFEILSPQCWVSIWHSGEQQGHSIGAWMTKKKGKEIILNDNDAFVGSL